MIEYKCGRCGLVFKEKEANVEITNLEVVVDCPNGCVVGTIFLPDICDIEEFKAGISVTESDIGRYVEYNDGNKPGQIGRIKSFNEGFVFVVYKCNGDWDNYRDYTGCATERESLAYKEQDNEKD